MKKIIFLSLIVLAICSCRKDNSSFVSGGTTNSAKGKCYIIESSNVEAKTNIKYFADSIIYEVISLVDPSANAYLTKEATGSFLFSTASRGIKDISRRIYLNSFGSVSKETKLKIGSDGKTLEEIPDSVNTYIYNAQKQLIKLEKRIYDEYDVYLKYDTKNRVNEVLISDVDSQSDTLFYYNNFKYLDQKKNDNLTNIGFSESLALYLVPSLRNVYITHYDMHFFSADGDALECDYQYSFKDGSLSQAKTTFTFFDIPVEYVTTFKMSCK